MQVLSQQTDEVLWQFNVSSLPGGFGLYVVRGYGRYTINVTFELYS